MQKILSILMLVGVSTQISSCATTTTTVLNNADGSYIIEASDETEADALQGGMKKADELCKAQNKSTIVKSHKSTYTGGMDQNTKGFLNTVTSITSRNSGIFIPKQDTSKDYKVTIDFKCM